MLGAGLIEGRLVDELVGIRPGDLAYESHSGAVFHPQDENQTDENVAFYEIQATGDQIDLAFGNYITDMVEPHAIFYTPWGATDFDVIERTTGENVISELSGFDTDFWSVDLSASDGAVRITNFDTADGVDGTQAAWLPYVNVFDRVR